MIMKDVQKFLDGCLKIYSPSGQENEMHMFTARKFQALGLRAVGIQHKPENVMTSSNLLLSRVAEKDAPHYFFNAHLDHANIVSKEYVEANGFGYDCKLGIAVIYALCKSNKFQDKNIDIWFDVQEENGLHGTRIFCKEEKHLLPFYKKRLETNILAYSLDGAHEFSKGRDVMMPAKTAKAYLEREGLIIKDNLLIYPNFSRNYTAVSKIMEDINKKYNDVCVLRYGASAVLLSKILPIVLLMPGLTKCNTIKEGMDANITQQTLLLLSKS